VQGVTLGGTGKAAGDRHPKIQEGVLIGAGATILGNIVVGRGAMVAAGSLVLKDVPAHRFNCHPLHLKVLRVEGSSLDV
jgi:serine O-acetyltransferase